MNERYIALSGGIYGHWGVGSSVIEAVANAKRAGAKKRDGCRVFRFWSELPFAPATRPAHEDEADCWVGRDGSCNWIRCEREELSNEGC